MLVPAGAAAVREQVPTATSVTVAVDIPLARVEAATVQTLVVVEVKLTIRPESVDALTLNVVPEPKGFSALGGAKVMVCAVNPVLVRVMTGLKLLGARGYVVVENEGAL